MNVLCSWYRKAQYPFWYAQAIGGILIMAYKEYNRTKKRYKLVDNEDDIGYHWEEVDE